MLNRNITILAVFSIFFLNIFLFNVALAANPCQNQLFCLADAFNSSSNGTVTICAGTNTVVNGFNFWYNGTGPLNITNGGIVSANYISTSNVLQDAYTNQDLNASSNPSACVRFVLNQTFTNLTVQVNATVYNLTNYGAAAQQCQGNSCNGTFFTINYVFIEARESTGTTGLANVLIAPFNNVTKAMTGTEPSVADSLGFWAEHCAGAVVGGTCIPPQGLPSAVCMFHGDSLSFTNCSITSTSTIYAMHPITSNITQQNVSLGVPLIVNLSTASSMSMLMPFSWNADSQENQMSSLSVSQINVSNYDTGELLFNVTSSGGGPDGGGGSPPAFMEPFILYKISFTSGGTIYNYPFMTPSGGISGAQIFVANASSFPLSTGYKTVIGKVVNESGSVMPNVVVYAQFFKGGFGAFGISFFNTSVTDSNGIFTMKLPRTRAPNEGPQGGYFPMYQFYLVSNQTTDGVPKYFTTTDNNNNKGYFAISDTTVLPALTLKAGGQVNVNVTLNSAGLVMSELSKLSNLGTGTVRSAVSGKFGMTSVFGNIDPPSSMILSLLSPIGNPLIDLYGKNSTMGDPMSGSIVTTCINTSASVTQGSLTTINCNLTTQGYLNLTTLTCNDIFDQSNCNYNNGPGSFDFWFKNYGIVRNSSNGAVSYINQEGVLLDSLIGSGGVSYPYLNIPMPPGTYRFELMPTFEQEQLNVYNSTAFTIVAGQTTYLTLTKQDQAWNIQPMFNPSIVLSGSNSINVSVMKKGGTTALNNTRITLNGTKILFLNKTNATAATQTISFGYDSNNMGGIFYNTTFNPSSLGLSAGKYWLMFNATNVTADTRYTTIMLMPLNAFDFQLGVDLGGFTFGKSQNITGKIFAYNTTGQPVGLNASSGNVTVKIYDMTGIEATSVTSSASNVVNGQGSINITMPSTIGFYEIVVSMKTDGCRGNGCVNNTVGVSDNWVQVSDLSIKTSTDRQGYRPTDSVTLSVQVLNATGNTPISGASIEVTVDNVATPALGSTGSDGKATITLNPSTYGTNGQWSFSWHNLKIKISKNIGTDVMNFDTWYGFDVRGFDLFLRPDRPSYQTTENVTIDVYGPLESFSIPKGGVEVDGTALAECFYDDLSCLAVVPGVNYHINTAWGIGSNRIELANWSVGHHDVEVTISLSGAEQKFYTGFDVSEYNIIVNTDSFSYDLNSWINLTVKANYLNGTAVSSGNVIATLYKAQPPNDINVTQNSSTTDSTGKTSMLLNASQPGFNYIKVNISGQLQFIGVQVSSLKMSLLDSNGNIVTNFNAAPGDTVSINVNATYGGSNVADGSIVKASMWAFGNKVDLPSNTTTSGNTSIIFQIPSFAPAQVYGLEIRLTTPNGDQGFAPQSTLTVTGGSALQISTTADRTYSNPYKRGDTALFTASLTYPNGAGASGYNVTFEIGSEGASPQTVGTAVTGSGGIATKSYLITSNNTDGPYFLHAYITNSSDVQAYSGFMISSLNVNVTSNKETYSPGENITLSIILINRTSGSQINATSGFIFTFNKEKGQTQQLISTSGQAQPYQVNISTANESNSVGTYPIGILMFVNQNQGVGFTMVNVKNASQSLNLTLPSTITAGTAFLVNISASTGSTAELRIFSPAAQNMTYENTSIALSGTPKTANVSITINNPGIYIFNTFVSGIGTTTTVMSVSASTSATQSVWTGTSTSANATTFSTSQSVYVLSNVANSTAAILTVDTTTNTTISYSLPLTLSSGSNYYGVFANSNLVSGRSYFVRLDTQSSTGMASAMFSVS